VARKHHRPWAPTAEDRGIAAVLGADAAFVPMDGRIGYVRGSGGLARSAVLDLVQAVYEACPGRAHTVLRQRIRVTSPVAPFDRAVVDVAAKRLGFVEAGAEPAGDLVDLAPWAAVARERGAAALFEPSKADVDADGLAAVLVDADGRPVLGARNAAATNRTLHAELNLVQGWVARAGGVPAGYRVISSLQPCRMCAAILVRAALGPIRVEYRRPDPGRLATRTALQALGWEREVGWDRRSSGSSG
jgi:tRNA(Arg) A34 adenosine deaminase TadA